MLATEKMIDIFVCLASVWYVLCVSLQSFMTCRRSVKELSLISYFLFLINLQRTIRAISSSIFLPDWYIYVTKSMVYIKKIGVTWWWWCYIHSIGVTWCGWWSIQWRGVTWCRWWSMHRKGVTWFTSASMQT